MPDIAGDAHLVAFCGLYCGACRASTKGKCPGCRENVKATWCRVRTCCIEHGRATCADCTDADPRECRSLNNIISKLFSLVFRSDRPACLERIGEIGIDAYACESAETGRQSIRRA